VAGIPSRLTLDSGDLPPAERAALEALVDRADFFALPPRMTSPVPDAFQYAVAIEREGRRHVVQADDRNAPEPLRELVRRLSALARGGAPPAG
jgi:hypothetical protein